MPDKNDYIVDVLNILHDGAIIRAVDLEDSAHFDVHIPYLTTLINPEFKIFTLKISGFRNAEFLIWPDVKGGKRKTINTFSEIFCVKPEIVECSFEKGLHKIICNIPKVDPSYNTGGELFFEADSIEVFDEAGKPYTLKQLDDLCSKYWDAWNKRHQK